jgi:aconitate hydratase
VTTDSFKSRSLWKFDGREYRLFRLDALKKAGFRDLDRLPFSLRILLENLLRHEDGGAVTRRDIEALASWSPGRKNASEIAFTPARVILQDFTGVPAVCDLAAMRDCLAKMGKDPSRINPLQPVDLVIDHSVSVDAYGAGDSLEKNTALEFERNRERYTFLKWGQQAFRNFRVVPPGTGIIHQVNLEYLASLVMASGGEGTPLVYPDTVVGTDSHTTMINGLGVLGWGVGGIEAEAAMLGQPVSMLIPEVVGFKLTGRLRAGATATDAVLAVTQILRKKGVVGKFVEFFGPGADGLPLADRATIANMAPEYGATMGFFPADGETLDFLRLTGRGEKAAAFAGAYLREQGLLRSPDSPEPVYSETISFDLSGVEPCLAGPKRPQDRVLLRDVKADFQRTLEALPGAQGSDKTGKKVRIYCAQRDFEIKHGSVVIASITSCTNTSNPAVMMAAGLLARKAVDRGLAVKPWVKTSLAPGSKVVMDYLREADLLSPLEKLRFHLVGYGCMTCIGNSGPLAEPLGAAIKDHQLVVAAVLSGNRNFEGRVNPLVKANYLASPPLVVAYALAGDMDVDLTRDPLGTGPDGKAVYLRDIWPSEKELQAVMSRIRPEMFESAYGSVFEGSERWRNIQAPSGDIFSWAPDSTYVKKPPFFDSLSPEPKPPAPLENARALAVFGDSITTDHISPAGSIAKDSPAAKYLADAGVLPKDFNSYGSRRGNHEVMMRGTFANIRLKNLLLPGIEGGLTRHFPDGESLSIYDAAMKYRSENVPLVIIAGKEYGCGSSRDWAAKGPALLGVRAVMAESYERIHRSNLIGMGILPLQFDGGNRDSFGLSGDEFYTVTGLDENLAPGKRLIVVAVKGNSRKEFPVICRIDTPVELAYYRHGGILQYVLSQMV